MVTLSIITTVLSIFDSKGSSMRKKPHTHTAWGVAQLGRRHRDSFEIGTGTIDLENNTATVYTDRIVRKDTGMIMLYPHGVEPPALQAKPQRPGESDGAGDEDEAEG
jgi:hypothetical protein